MRKVGSSIAGRDISEADKNVPIASSLGVRHYEVDLWIYWIKLESRISSFTPGTLKYQIALSTYEYDNAP